MTNRPRLLERTIGESEGEREELEGRREEGGGEKHLKGHVIWLPKDKMDDQRK